MSIDHRESYAHPSPGATPWAASCRAPLAASGAGVVPLEQISVTSGWPTKSLRNAPSWSRGGSFDYSIIRPALSRI